MKKYIGFLVLMMVIFAGARAAGAEENTGTMTPAEQKAQMETRRAELEAKRTELKAEMEAKKKEMAENRAEKKDEMKDRREEMKKNTRARIAAGFMKRVENLSQIAVRLKARIEKMKAMGIDTTSSTELVVKAEASIMAAETSGAKAKAIAEADGSLDEIKANLASAKDSLKQAHTYLSEAVKDLKAKAEAYRASQNTSVNTSTGTSTTTTVQ